MPFGRNPPGSNDVFVAKLNPTGSSLLYSTFLGGIGSDFGAAIAVDPAGSAYVTGSTDSADFPTTTGAFDRTYDGSGDVFVTKLNPTGTTPVYSTYLGNGDMMGRGIAVDAAGNAYLTGAAGPRFPITFDAFQPTFGGAGDDAFVAKLNPTGARLVYSSFLGGSDCDIGTAIALDAVGNAYVSGETGSRDFPTTSGTVHLYISIGFIAKIGTEVVPVCRLSRTGKNASGQQFIEIAAQDTGSGLESIQVVTQTSATVQVPAFTSGTFSPVVVTATKLDQTEPAVVALRVTNQAGAFTDCDDPALVNVGHLPGSSPIQVSHHLTRAESHITVTNATPGVYRLEFVVNGHRFAMTELRDGEARTLDVSSAMRNGANNVIMVVAHGPTDSSAVVLVSDS